MNRRERHADGTNQAGPQGEAVVTVSHNGPRTQQTATRIDMDGDTTADTQHTQCEAVQLAHADGSRVNQVGFCLQNLRRYVSG